MKRIVAIIIGIIIGIIITKNHHQNRDTML